MHKRRMLCSSSTTSSLIRESFLVTDCSLTTAGPHERSRACWQALRADGRGRKADDERAALRTGIVAAQNFSVVRLNDSVTDAQTQAGSLSDGLRREKRIENAVWVRNAGTVVPEMNLGVLRGRSRLDFDPAGTPGLLDGVEGIVENVKKHLLELMRIGNDEGRIRGQALDDFDVAVFGAVGAQLDRLAKHGVDFHELPLRRHLAGKAQHVLDDEPGALGFLQNDLKILAGKGRELRILEQQIGESDDPR